MQIVCIRFIISGFPTAFKTIISHDLQGGFSKRAIDGRNARNVYIFRNIVANHENAVLNCVNLTM